MNDIYQRTKIGEGDKKKQDAASHDHGWFIQSSERTQHRIGLGDVSTQA